MSESRAPYTFPDEPPYPEQYAPSRTAVDFAGVQHRFSHDALSGLEASVIAHAMEKANDGLLYDVDGEKMSAAEAAYRVYQQRNELRRLLAPLLDAPCRIEDERFAVCVFCGKRTDFLAEGDYRPRFGPVYHEAGCATMRGNELLGRTPAGNP